MRACLLLSNGAVGGNDDIVRYHERALAESGDDERLRAIVLADISANRAVARVEQIPDAEELALEALATGRRRRARRRAWRPLRARLGPQPPRATGRRPLQALPRSLGRRLRTWPSPRIGSPPCGSCGGATSIEARVRLARLLSAADERGEPTSYALQRLHLCELELRTGEWDAAAAPARRVGARRRAPDVAVLRPLPCAPRRRSRPPRRGAERCGGRDARAAPSRTGPRWDVLEALRARGIAALLAGDPGARGGEPGRRVGPPAARGGRRARGVSRSRPTSSRRSWISGSWTRRGR